MAKEYIERGALLEDMATTILPRDAQKLYLAMRGKVRNAPAADVVEVVHGEWIKKYCWEEDYVCSVCGELAHKNAYGICAEFTNYCPNCGAKMDGKGDV